jgi:hypothetical protein
MPHYPTDFRRPACERMLGGQLLSAQPVVASSLVWPPRNPPSPLSSSQGTVSSVAHLGDQHQRLRSEAATLKRNLAFPKGARARCHLSPPQAWQHNLCDILCRRDHIPSP